MIDLNPDELVRYQRHFPVIGLDGQKILKKARVLCVGAGGLGCPALQYLAASGIGTLGIIDGDRVELSNLQRQILFTEKDIGQEKASVAANRLQAMNRHLQVQVYTVFLSKDNQEIIQDFDVILDATDNYAARYLLNDLCRQWNKPLVSASIYQYDAQISVFNYQEGPCYQCLYPAPPKKEYSPNCNLSGIVGALAGIAGSLQAMEALKVILGTEGILSGKLLCFNGLSMRFNTFKIQKQICTTHPQVDLTDNNTCSKATSVEDQNAIQVKELSQLLHTHVELQLIDVRESYEREICHIGGDLIPLSELERKIPHLDKTKLTVIYCKSGMRSRQAQAMLLHAGFEDVRHLEGGILKWRAMINPSLNSY